MSDLKRALHGMFGTGKPTAYQYLKAAEGFYGSKREVAEQLGVSQRTVERWMRSGKLSGGRFGVSRGNRDKIESLYNTPEIRHSMAAPRKTQKALSQPAQVSMSGVMGPVIGGKDYMRERDVSCMVSAEGMRLIHEAWATGDEGHIREVTREVMELEYGVGGWNWEDSGFSIKF